MNFRHCFRCMRETDVIAISAGLYHSVAIRADGAVIATGNNDYGQCNVSDWTDIRIPGSS